MHFTEQLQAPVPVATAWEFIWQAPRLAGCLPGCTGVDEVEPGKMYRAHIADRVGPYRVAFGLDVTIVETVPHERVRVLARGDDARLGLAQRIDLVVVLAALDAQRTQLRVDAEVEVGGAIAQLGGFLIRRKAGQIVNQFARNVAAELRSFAG